MNGAAATAADKMAGRLRAVGRERAVGLARRGTLALLDEGLASGANLVLSLVLARWLAPQEYGFFALLYYGIATGCVSFYNALVLQPMMVLGPARHAGHLPLYLHLLARWQRAAMLLIFLVIALGGLAYGTWAGDATITGSLSGLAVGLPGLIYMQYIRRLCYLRRRPEAAARRGLVYLALLAAGAALLAALRLVHPGTILLVMGLAGFGSGLAAGRYVGRPDGAATAGDAPSALGWAEGLGGEQSRLVLKELWGYGRWVAGANLAGWAAQSLPYFFSSGLLGLAGTGAFQAAQNLVKPLPHVNTSFRMLTLPSWSERWGRRGSRAVVPQVVRWALLLGGAALAYAVTVALVGPRLFEGVYHGRYAFELLLVGPLLLGMACQSVTAAFMTGLQAIQLPQVGVKAQLVAVVVGVALGPLMVKAWGVTGLGSWVALQSAAQLSVVVLVFRKEARRAGR